MVRKTCFHAIVLALAGSAVSYACNVPVFRYALERWEPDRYEAVVLHRGGLSASERDAVKLFQEFSGESTAKHANIVVRTADLDSPGDAAMRGLLEAAGSPEPPCVVLGYPASLGKRPAVAAVPLTRRDVESILESPVRREIARRIMGGESAVWILLESGDTSRDKKARSLLEREIKKLESTLVLPAAVEGNEAGSPVVTVDGPDVRIDFSIVRLSRTDPAERMLVGMLVHSEPDLQDYADQPMAFPVYGRGRALYALVGEGITPGNIEKACRFIIGACSCEVKALNPGVDLLVAADWAKAVTKSVIPDETIPPLTGTSGLVETRTDTALTGVGSWPVNKVFTAADTVSSADAVAGPGGLIRNMIIALGILFAASAGLTAVVVSRRGNAR